MRKFFENIKISLYCLEHFPMLGFHKFNEYLIHFSKAFAKSNQRTKDLVMYL